MSSFIEDKTEINIDNPDFQKLENDFSLWGKTVILFIFEYVAQSKLFRFMSLSSRINNNQNKMGSTGC